MSEATSGSGGGAANTGDGDGAAGAPAILTVVLGALRENYCTLRDHAEGAECAAVVKADAYGTGARQAVQALAQEGCKTFFVATLPEAGVVRAAAPQATIYVLDGLFPQAAAGFVEIDARPVLGSLPEIRDWAAFCLRTGVPRRAALHIDTGMNRLGLRLEDIDVLAGDMDLLDTFETSLVISHLACADSPDDPKNEAQRTAFDELRAKLPAAPASLANSAGILLGPSYHYEMVRAGIALYGGRAVVRGANPMRPVVLLEGRVAQIRNAEAGETVGYGAAQTLNRPTRIATVTVGYADGFFRRLGASDGYPGAAAYVGEYRAPLLGRVSMDLITIDVTDVPEELVQRGTLVELLGPHVGVDDIAAQVGTIGYEVLTALGRRYHRRYIGL